MLALISRVLVKGVGEVLSNCQFAKKGENLLGALIFKLVVITRPFLPMMGCWINKTRLEAI